MGTFYGHVIPGACFFSFAIWWTIRVNIRYWNSKKKGTKFTSTLIFPASCLSGRLKHFPFEGVAKIFFAVFGIFGELYIGQIETAFKMEDAQHAAMFFLFGLSGVVDIFVHYKAPLPENIQYIAWCLALGVEGLLFHFHLDGRTPLDVRLHTLLVYVIVGSIVAVFLEMRYRHSFLAVLGRCYLTLLQSTWFFQVGYVLYNPFSNGKPIWDEKEHTSLILAALVFACHCAAHFILMLIGGAIISRFYRHDRRDGAKYDVSLHRLLRHNSDEQAVNSMDEEVGSDVEYESPTLLSR